VPLWQRIYLAACCGVIGFALAYSLATYAGWPRAVYDPVAREIFLASPPVGRLPLSFLGMVAWGAGGASVGAGVGAAAAALLRRPLDARPLRVVGAWALTAAALGGLFQTWNLWPF
jgi:hypothetical protein